MIKYNIWKSFLPFLLLLVTACAVQPVFLNRSFTNGLGPEESATIKGGNTARLHSIVGDKVKYYPSTYRFSSAFQGFDVSVPPGSYEVSYYAASEDLARVTSLTMRTIEVEAGKTYYIHSTEIKEKDIISSWIDDNAPDSEKTLAAIFKEKCLKSDFNEAKNYCNEAYKRGEPLGARYLALQYADTKSEHFNYRESTYWRKKAADNGDIPSMLAYARILIRGDGAPQNVRQAQKLLQELLSSDDDEHRYSQSRANLWLGLIEEDGLLGHSDKKKAMEYYLKGIELGSPMAHFHASLLGEKVNFRSKKQNLVNAFVAAVIGHDEQYREHYKLLTEKYNSIKLDLLEEANKFTPVNEFYSGSFCGLNNIIENGLWYKINEIELTSKHSSTDQLSGLPTVKNTLSIMKDDSEVARFKPLLEKGKPICVYLSEKKNQWRLSRSTGCDCGGTL